MTRRWIVTANARRRREPAEPPWTNAEIFVFDVEGTLVDAMMPTLRCWRETLEAFGHDVSLAEIHRYAGMDTHEMLARLLPGATKNERQEFIERQDARFREDYLPHIPPLPGVRPLFEELKRRGSKIAIATDCAKDELRRYLEVANVEGLVDAIGCGDDIRRGKPAPAVLEIALRRVKAGRKLAVFVGDTPFDAQAARKAGVISVGVLTGHFSERELSDTGCRAVFRDLTALRAAIMRPAAADAGELVSAA
jgi:phosphoglycolate phosphatase-like HAD superfamily hydrolase